MGGGVEPVIPRRRYYQALADLHIIAGSLVVLNERLASLPERDADDLAMIARVAAKCIERGPACYHHVIEQSPDIAGIWRQLFGEAA